MITGANGMLGANLCTMYAKENEVFATDKNIPDFLGCHNFKLDITDEKDLKLVGQINPDMIIHCAALVNVDYCDEHPEEALKVNCAGTKKLARESVAVRGADCRFIYISSDAVFDGISGNYEENSTPNPINEYGKSKLCAERAIISECNEDRNFIIIRTNIIGWNRRDKYSLAEWMLHQLETGQEFPAIKDVFFSPILVNNLGDIILELAKKKYQGIIHVAGSKGCSKLEFARIIAETFGLDASVIVPSSLADLNLKAKRAQNMILDVSRAKRILMTPMLDVEDGIRRFKELKESGFYDALKMKQG